MRDVPPPEFAPRVQAEVERLSGEGLTVQQIAEQAGVARSVLYRYMDGGMPDTPSRLFGLARAFGCSMDYLWGRAHERTGLYGADMDAISAAAEAMSRAAGELRLAVQGAGQ